MHTLVSKCRMTCFAPLLLVCMLCATGSVFPQDKANRNAPAIRFANVDVSKPSTATYEQVLSDPQFEWNVPGWKILTFTLSFQPKGKDYYGPFPTKGGKLTEKEIAIFKAYRDQGIKTLRVFIEDIKAQGPDTQVRNLGSLIFTIEQH